jgi:adenylate cyclase
MTGASESVATLAPLILVVDDEPDLEALVVQKFRREIRDGKVRFLFAHDGVEALDMLGRHDDVAMVLSDINMPRMDGLTLLLKIGESVDARSTIIVSAYGDMSNIRTAMNRGAFDFVTKPIDFADLQATIDKTLRHVGAMRESRQRQAEAERAHAALSRYFSPNLAEQLAAGGSDVDVSGQRREVTSMFTDIAGFTSLVETLDPATIAPLLNDYLGGMTDIVFAHGGTVVKIVGDAMHVLFNAPADQPDHAERAVACALELDVCSEAFRRRWAKRGLEIGVTRIGIHAGLASVGNFGGGRHFDYTAYGDAINTAARLETANKQLGTRICVSESVVSLHPDFKGRPVGDLVLRGRAEPIRSYEPLSAEVYAETATATYLDAFRKLEAGDRSAMPAFAALVGLHSEDQLAGFHLKRLLNGATGSIIDLD